MVNREVASNRLYMAVYMDSQSEQGAIESSKKCDKQKKVVEIYDCSCSEWSGHINEDEKDELRTDLLCAATNMCIHTYSYIFNTTSDKQKKKKLQKQIKIYPYGSYTYIII